VRKKNKKNEPRVVFRLFETRIVWTQNDRKTVFLHKKTVKNGCFIYKNAGIRVKNGVCMAEKWRVVQ
jgi:hypothetical protein